METVVKKILVREPKGWKEMDPEQWALYLKKLKEAEDDARRPPETWTF